MFLGVNQTLNSNNFSIKLRDDSGTGTGLSSYVNIVPYGMFNSSSSGWSEFRSDLIYNGNQIIPSMSYGKLRLSLVLSSSSGATYAFKHPELFFKEALTSAGVKYYSDIDNSNNSDIFSYIKTGVCKKIE
jgi:hypothetical protein